MVFFEHAEIGLRHGATISSSTLSPEFDAAEGWVHSHPRRRARRPRRLVALGGKPALTSPNVWRHRRSHPAVAPAACSSQATTPPPSGRRGVAAHERLQIRPNTTPTADP